MCKEYHAHIARYGKTLGKEIFAQMLAHYRQLLPVDTGCFDRKKAEAQVKQIAAALGLEYSCKIGLLPQCLLEKITACGNLAGAGAKRAP